MNKLFFIIIMLFAFSGTTSAESNHSLVTSEKLENTQEKESVKKRNIKQHQKVTRLRSKLAMILVLGNATKYNKTRPYASHN